MGRASTARGGRRNGRAASRELGLTHERRRSRGGKGGREGNLLGGKQERTDDHLVHHAAKAEPVHRLRVPDPVPAGVLQEHLRRPVAPSPVGTDQARRRLAGQPQVGEPRLPLFVHEDVVRLQVPVHNAVLVQMLQSQQRPRREVPEQRREDGGEGGCEDTGYGGGSFTSGLWQCSLGRAKRDFPRRLFPPLPSSSISRSPPRLPCLPHLASSIVNRPRLSRWKARSPPRIRSKMRKRSSLLVKAYLRQTTKGEWTKDKMRRSFQHNFSGGEGRRREGGREGEDTEGGREDEAWQKRSEDKWSVGQCFVRTNVLGIRRPRRGPQDAQGGNGRVRGKRWEEGGRERTPHLIDGPSPFACS